MINPFLLLLSRISAPCPSRLQKLNARRGISFFVYPGVSKSFMLCAVCQLFFGCGMLGFPLPNAYFFDSHFFDSVQCKNQAFVGGGGLAFLSTSNSSGSVIRVGIYPFDVPESFAPRSPWQQDFGFRVAQSLTRNLLRTQEFPIVEFQDQANWLGKREEFFSGNYQAINYGRQAGYDMIFVGYVDQVQSSNHLDVYGKLIDLSKATTIWFGKTEAQFEKGVLTEVSDQAGSVTGLSEKSRSPVNQNLLAEQAAKCLAIEIVGSDRKLQ